MFNNPEIEAHVRATYPAGFADYLLSGDCWTAEGPANFRVIFDGLVARGYMRRSRRGRYWWVR